MNFETINTHIEATDPQEQQKILNEKIEQISLIYADKQFHEHQNIKFSKAVALFSPTADMILEPIFHLDNFDVLEYKKQTDKFLGSFYKELDLLYDQNGFDLGKITDLIALKRDGIKQYLGVENLLIYNEEKKSNDLKIIKFNKITNINRGADKKYEKLKTEGFSDVNKFLEVHLDTFFDTGEKNFSSELIKNDLAFIAKNIIDEEPETAAIIGKSWVLDTPIAKRLGFKCLKPNNKKNDFSTWLQFIDKDGQINQKRLNKLMETEELPFNSVVGYIPTEEFLKRYLPEDRRGKITLKKVNPARSNFWEKLSQEAKLMNNKWALLIKNKGDFDELILHNQGLNQILDFVGPEKKAIYFAFYQEMFEKKIPYTDFFKYKNTKIEQIDKQIQESMNNDLYQKQEIIIE